MSREQTKLRAKVYGIPGSNATWVTRLVLDHKHVPYKLVTLPTEWHRPMVRARGFPNKTVPAVKIDGRKLQGTRLISRELEKLRPEPPLYPAGPELRKRVEEAERWGDEVLQDIPRRITFSPPVRKHAQADYASFFDGPLMGMPPKLAVATSGRILAATGKRQAGKTDANEVAKRAVASVPMVVDHVDALIADGTIGGAQPNAADFQIAPSIRLLMSLDDLRPFIASRPTGEFALRVAPHYRGRFREVLPADWLLPLRTDFPAATAQH